ncbi:MAG: glycosyltransferase, partial [Candidatus Kerfeldbacteria bacterium]|nr:glycosyltransferase [Candidatus Kerfeldbacteria bacterium]
MRILLVGGGTVGSVTPLLALAESIWVVDRHAVFLFVGTPRGPERKLVESAKMRFAPISAGKLRRYASWKNVTDLGALAVGWIQSLSLLRKFRPDVIVSAGSFVAVPVVWAGKSLGIPSIIHQQDIVPGLANRLCQPAASRVTVAFESSLKHYPKRKVVWTGNPVRSQLTGHSPSAARKKFDLKDTLPTVLAFGGGTGALRLNQLIAEAGLNLVKHVQILHITGGRENTFRIEDANYRSVEFLTENMADAYAAADIVVCRGGLSSLSELSALGKPAIIIPIPGTHQEKNAEYFRERKAIIQLDERRTNHADLESAILGLLQDVERRETLSRNIRLIGHPDAGDRLAAIVLDIARPRELTRTSQALTKVVSDIQLNEPLAKHTNFKLGGPAAIFAVCRRRQEIIGAIQVLKNENADYVLLGGGANLVFPDAGIPGVVLQIRNEEFTVDGEYVEIGAGVNTGKAASLCLQAGLTGLEFIVGIYGTIGGAVRGNAGSFGTEMKDITVSCDVLTEAGTVETWTH